ncbi:16S rRNA (guanine(966)-N(2))-methyltransferase RsmD [Mesomycoplasma hyopneumoniae]|uniref:Putative DNA methylase n=1 Tax=Mesomycoplasma hyopneumoniae (strain J / ATCC 25934 / NCTC 10110) TaxID=262719 RepID=Q4AAI0_MESHJ|nr:16S rRNA (guanine(966)-N(2))-methyltransferase RsmD [Mesomycoplasma hyopneumoniae]AAZ44241.1 putative DNA methylase [Mesomycoplasma hyopneumoniae J]NYN91773.1 16S rRNA (guanine(966)-N(2))-methyltransferase RsmD [Mesomycoplasma hyopneumoniae]QLG43284.1 16S rRNA (guanine(966)-N(2))-methyltransferase RsmD [Mesomycoplasma hyopneumoniae]UIF67183.1 16S rRNA (guanine(966)-N(2))-methyltransferase RsmD [Mesomycoplasma hyopneumoniae]
MIRIISGNYRGAVIKNPEFSVVRPMSSRCREAIFSQLQFEIPNSKVLDLFAGTGAIGLEATSRGAKKVVATELNQKAYQNIVDFCKKYNIKNYQIFNKSAIFLINDLKNKKFDFIFLDPPHSEEEITKKCFWKIAENNLLAKNGLIIYKTNLGSKLIPDIFSIHQIKKYGKNSVFFLKYYNEGKNE